MAEMITTAAAAATLLTTLGNLINEFTGNLKGVCQRLERRVRSMLKFYQVHKDDPLYRDEGLDTALKTETALLENTNKRLENMAQPRCWQIRKRRKLRNFLKESERNIQQSSQTINNLLTHIGTGALIQIADQGQNDPNPQAVQEVGPQDPNPQAVQEVGPQDPNPQAVQEVGPQDSIPQAVDVDGPQDPNPQAVQEVGPQEPPLATSTPTKNGADLNKTREAGAWMSEFFDRHGDYFPDDEIMVIPFKSKKAVHDLMVQERGSEVAKYGTFSDEWKKSFLKCIPSNKDTSQPNHTTITITTMKLSDINLPYFSSTDNLTGDTALPRVHLTGAVFKVRTFKATHIFRDLNHIPHDTNFVVHCILNLLAFYKNRLDKTLLLQLQRSEIKTQVLLSSVALLVDQQIFKTIFVRFLPETFTIEAGETAFSGIDKKLCSKDIPYLDELDEIIGGIENVRVGEIKYVFDIEKWISTYLVKEWPDVNNEKWFKLHKTGDNTVMHHDSNLVPKWTKSATVPQPPDSTPPRLDNGVVCFEEPPDVTKSPIFVDLRLDSVIDLDAVEKKLGQKYQPEQSGQYLNKWKSVFDTHRKVPPSSLSWPLPKLKDEGESGASSLR